MQLSLTVEPQVLTEVTQQTPNPEAQFPLLTPPARFEHSSSVRQVPVRPVEPPDDYERNRERTRENGFFVCLPLGKSLS